jgi:hypothetical protein
MINMLAPAFLFLLAINAAPQLPFSLDREKAATIPFSAIGQTFLRISDSKTNISLVSTFSLLANLNQGTGRTELYTTTNTTFGPIDFETVLRKGSPTFHSTSSGRPTYTAAVVSPRKFSFLVLA